MWAFGSRSAGPAGRKEFFNFNQNLWAGPQAKTHKIGYSGVV